MNHSNAPAAFPMEPKMIGHAHGGRVVKVHGIEHLKGKPRDGYSTDFWFFRADVEWNDGSGTSVRTEVAPHMLCCDAPSENVELQSLLKAMGEYLAEHGEWKRGGKSQGWFAHRGPGRIAKAAA
jgi:hypothetical protein